MERRFIWLCPLGQHKENLGDNNVSIPHTFEILNKLHFLLAKDDWHLDSGAWLTFIARWQITFSNWSWCGSHILVKSKVNPCLYFFIQRRIVDVNFLWLSTIHDQYTYNILVDLCEVDELDMHVKFWVFGRCEIQIGWWVV